MVYYNPYITGWVVFPPLYNNSTNQGALFFGGTNAEVLAECVPSAMRWWARRLKVWGAGCFFLGRGIGDRWVFSKWCSRRQPTHVISSKIIAKDHVILTESERVFYTAQVGMEGKPMDNKRLVFFLGGKFGLDGFILKRSELICRLQVGGDLEWLSFLKWILGWCIQWVWDAKDVHPLCKILSVRSMRLICQCLRWWW